MLRPTSASLAVLVLAAAAGCSDERATEPAKTPYEYSVTVYEESQPSPEEIAREVSPEEVQPVAGTNVDVIEIEDKIAQICEIPTPHFSFDSANLQNRAEPSLDALAACLKEGALEGRSVILIGQADPRGSDSYNLGLGKRRASAVADYLSAQGVDAARIITTSRGEEGASGTDQTSWADDRRVEIILRE